MQSELRKSVLSMVNSHNANVMTVTNMTTAIK
jgi:hypothetical protein